MESFSGGDTKDTTIPVRLPAVGGTPEPSAHEPKLPAPAISGRVLVVDDNQDVGDSLAELLDLVGYETVVARNGLEAVNLAGDRRPGIALIDIGLPDIDGHEVARRLRADPRHQGMFLIALTGWGQDDDHRRSKEAGFDQHLVKPVDLDRLLDILQSVGQSRPGE